MRGTRSERILFFSFCSLLQDLLMCIDFRTGRGAEDFLTVPRNIVTGWRRVARLRKQELSAFETIQKLLDHSLTIDVAGDKNAQIVTESQSASVQCNMVKGAKRHAIIHLVRSLIGVPLDVSGFESEWEVGQSSVVAADGTSSRSSIQRTSSISTISATYANRGRYAGRRRGFKVFSPMYLPLFLRVTSS